MITTKRLLENCVLCPRNCHADRLKGQVGCCGQTGEIRIGRADLHMWEEPCISGDRGSGTVFFSGCSLGCVYCQNYKLSRGLTGKIITQNQLSDIFLRLQEKGAHNINLVTPTHFIPQIIEAITIAKEKGLVIPIVYNTSGYEKFQVLKLLKGYANIYLPDFKYFSDNIAKKYSGCRDYFKYASKAVEEMLMQTGEAVFNEDGIMTKGVIVRHLVLPGQNEDSKAVIKYLHNTFGNSVYLSIMNQYTPLSTIKEYPELNRKITDREYDEVVNYAISIGVENGFIQDGETAMESFIPEFNGYTGE